MKSATIVSEMKNKNQGRNTNISPLKQDYITLIN